MDKKLSIGLFGVGHLGKIHLKCLKSTAFDVVGLYDPDPAVVQWAKEHAGVEVFEDPSTLVDKVDAVDIVSSTISHYEVAKMALQKGKHAFIEKPVASTLAEAYELQKMAEKGQLKIQVGHVERYNPAMLALNRRTVNPKFIEGHRLTTFNTRGNDVSVTLDLMIHDLDLVLHLVDSEVEHVQANGVCVVNDTPDICNARISFKNGTVANLTASRISMKHMRKLRMFQANEYISLDFLKKETQIVQLQSIEDRDASQFMTIDSSAGKKILHVESPEIKENNAIVDELSDFYTSIIENTPTTVSIRDAIRAMELAYRIEEEIRQGR